MSPSRLRVHSAYSTLLRRLAGIRRRRVTLSAFAVGLLILPGTLQAQERFQVLIPYFEPRNDSDDDFGKDASEKLRELINTLPTHVAMDEDEIEDQVGEFNMDIDDLTCLLTIQLAAQIDAWEDQTSVNIRERAGRRKQMPCQTVSNRREVGFVTRVSQGRLGQRAILSRRDASVQHIKGKDLTNLQPNPSLPTYVRHGALKELE